MLVAGVPVIGVRVLGPLEVTVDGVAANAGGPRQRCVLARLVAARGQVVSADRLIEDLYVGEAPPRALAAVQSYISHLRRALDPGHAAWDRSSVLAAVPPGYALRLSCDVVDAWAFEQDVHQAAALSEPAVVHASLSAALASWRGQAYQEFGGLPWAELEASRLAELRLTAIEKRADAALRLGRAAQLIADLDQLAAEHPLREELWRLLALALYQSGRQGDALAALRRARTRLAEELGVDPGPALRELESDILAQAPHLTAPAIAAPHPPVPGSAPPRSDPAAGPVPTAGAPYLGRDAELLRAQDAAAQAAAGQLAIMLVAGEAGAGKTALTDQVSQRLSAEGWLVTAGRCPEHEGAPAGWPWAQALRRLAAATPPAEPEALAALLTDDPARDADAAAARFRLHQAIGRYLDTVSRTAPVLVVLDDVHRADSETLAILTDIAADLTASRILLLATYRPAEAGDRLSGCLARLAAREPVRVILRGLDEAAAGELIQATCTRPVDEATTRAIAERTGGNPFFIKETARLLDSEGALAAAHEVPAGVREVLERRIARLPATAQTILRQACVIGVEIDADVLGEVADAEEHVLLDAVEAGLITGLITEPSAGRIRFAHALVRDTLYHGLSRLRRTRLHARAAEAIERNHPGDVAALAYHFAEAGTDPAKAARYCRLTAEQAEQRFAYHEAARLWEQGIVCLDQADASPADERLELRLGLVRTLSQTEQMYRARSLRRDAIRAALPLADPVLLAEVITAFDAPRAWFIRDYGNPDDELVGVVEQTLAGLSAGDSLLRARLLTTLAIELEGDESERGYQASVEAVAMARRLGDPDTLMIAIAGRWIQSFRHGGFDERCDLTAEALATPGQPVNVEAGTQLMLATVNCGSADLIAADRYADEAGRMIARYDFPTFAFGVTMYRAMRAALNGDPAQAEKLYQRAADQVDRFGRPEQGVGVRILSRAAALITQNRTAELIAELDAYPGIPGLLPDLYALALAAAGRIGEAREVAANPIPIRRDRIWLLLTAVRSLLAIAIDDRERAESAYQVLLPYAGQPAGAEGTLVTLWPVALILGDLARYLGLAQADGHYRHALAIAERANAQPWLEAAAQRLYRA